MLFVFRVDTGSMLTLDMGLALETVAQLKNAIERACRIPPDQQVLLVSGGESLDMSARVCTYSAGTDTNPIFLFSKAFSESRCQSPPLDISADLDISTRVDKSLDLPSTYDTVQHRASIAQTLSELSREILRDCETLAHEQHLQQQGWSAALANLDDLVAYMKIHCAIFERDFASHLESREEQLEDLKKFSTDLEVLSQIPILPCLLKQAMSVLGFDGDSESMTLLEWISARDNSSTLYQLIDHCEHFLLKVDQELISRLIAAMHRALHIASQPDMKEIGGICNRLCGLESLMVTARKTVQDQTEMAQGFQQNLVRVSQMGDTSILPDLCVSHYNQLLVMQKNQTKLRDIQKRFYKAKGELITNLTHRLGWVTYSQNSLRLAEDELLVYHESWKRAQTHYNIVQQVRRSPEMYCLAVAEVVRRRKFSHAFMRWALDLSQRWLATYNEESEKRREFKVQFQGHFLESLFPGLNDEPPTFASQAPEPFDEQLPELTEADMNALLSTLPSLAISVSWTELSSVAQMLLSHTKDDVAGSRNLDLEGDGDEFEKVSLNHPQITDEGAQSEMMKIESLGERLTAATVALRVELAEIRELVVTERDGIAVLFYDIQRLIAQLTESYVKQLSELEVKFQSEQLRVIDFEEAVKLKDELLSFKEESIIKMREEMIAKQITFEEERQQSEAKFQERLAASEEENKRTQEELSNERSRFETSLSQAENAAREAKALFDQKLSEASAEVTKLAGEMENLIERHKKTTEEIEKRAVQTEMNCKLKLEERTRELEERHIKTISELETKNAQLLEAEKQQAREQLAMDYKTELTSLRSRFRLMSATSMEKSPSDSSLEKIERSEVIELVNHEAILAQIKEDAEVKLEKAVAAAVEAERKQAKLKFEEEMRQARIRMEEEKQVWLQEAVTRALADKERGMEQELENQKLLSKSMTSALEEKEKQVEALLVKQQSLSTECQRHRDTVKLLSERTYENPLTQLVEDLEKERKELREELTALKEMQQSSLFTSMAASDMSTSVAMVKDNIVSKDATTSPEHSRSLREKAKIPKGLRESLGRVCINSCNRDDPVIVIWNIELSNYVILQESSTLYFLHPDCLDKLGLRPASDGSPRRMYALATVVNKEYCHARKSNNRYKVPRDTPFYLVSVTTQPSSVDVPASEEELPSEIALCTCLCVLIVVTFWGAISSYLSDIMHT